MLWEHLVQVQLISSTHTHFYKQRSRRISALYFLIIYLRLVSPQLMAAFVFYWSPLSSSLYCRQIHSCRIKHAVAVHTSLGFSEFSFFRRHITAHINVNLGPYHPRVMAHIMGNCKKSPCMRAMSFIAISSIEQEHYATLLDKNIWHCNAVVLFCDIFSYLRLYRFIGEST